MLKQNGSQKIYQICLSVVTLAVAAQFIVQIWLLYLNGGAHPYTVENVAAHLARIRGCWAWLVLAIVGAFVFPSESQSLRASRNADQTLQTLQCRLPSERKTEEMRRLRRFQYGVCVVCAIVCMLVSVAIVVLMLDSGYRPTFAAAFFTEHTEAEKLTLAAILSIATLGFCTAAVYVRENAVYREIDLVKTEIANAAKEGIVVRPAAKQPEKREVLVQKYPVLRWFSTEKFVLISRIAIAAAGCLLFIVGICNGGMADVLEKAVQICTQCIGLG